MSSLDGRNLEVSNWDSALARPVIEFLTPRQLDGTVTRDWEKLRRSIPRQQSPYFDLEFVQAVARVRSDVEIAMVRDQQGAIQCFLPYQRVGRRAEPVGGRLNDVHGIVGDASRFPNLIPEIMKTRGINAFSFHASIMDVDSGDPFVFRKLNSHYVDLQCGWDQGSDRCL